MNRLRNRLSVLFGLTCVLMFACWAAAAEIKPFNGKNFDGWTAKGGKLENSKWTVGVAKVDPKNPRALVAEPAGDAPGELVNTTGGGRDIYSLEKFGDCIIEVEVMVPQGSNSGIYVMGEYEVQVLDSYGKTKVGPGDMGGIYGATAPRVNACGKPGEWQKFRIEFQAPRFEGGKKVANAKFIKVELNGQVIHENVEMKQQTPGGVTGREHPTGPLMFQGDHGPVAYRNIKIITK